MPSRIPEPVAQDRVNRYIDGEPLWSIAQDHNRTIQSILATIQRRAPWALGRPRGGGPRQWPT